MALLRASLRSSSRLYLRSGILSCSWRCQSTESSAGNYVDLSPFVTQLNERPEALSGVVEQLSAATRVSLIKQLIHQHEVRHGRVIDPSSFFLEADSNRDGVLTEAEFSAWIEKNRSWFGSRGSASTSTNRREENSDEPVEEPSRKQLWHLAISTGVPFVGFGFLDNAIMILAGNTIEQSLGVTLGLSTLAAAGLGNLMSDVAGIGLGNTIEAASHRLGLPNPELSTAQRRSVNVKWVRVFASIVGIAFGCLLGMFPLLFMKSEHEARLRRIFDVIDENGSGGIDFHELYSAFSMLGIQIPEEELQRFFDFIDIDGNGVVNFEEFCYLVQHLRAKFRDNVEEELKKNKMKQNARLSS